MEIIITQWALDSYLSLKHAQVFDARYYRSTLRPDVMLLSQYPNDPKFKNGKFWSPATTRSGRVPGGYKMKWHNVGNGNVQLRLPVALIGGQAYLCEAYVKSDGKHDQRMMARFDVHVQRLRNGRYVERGRL